MNVTSPKPANTEPQEKERLPRTWKRADLQSSFLVGIAFGFQAGCSLLAWALWAMGASPTLIYVCAAIYALLSLPIPLVGAFSAFDDIPLSIGIKRSFSIFLFGGAITMYCAPFLLGCLLVALLSPNKDGHSRKDEVKNSAGWIFDQASHIFRSC